MGLDYSPAEVTLVKERVVLGPRGGGPPPGDGFEGEPIKEICDGMYRELKDKEGIRIQCAREGVFIGNDSNGGDICRWM